MCSSLRMHATRSYTGGSCGKRLRGNTAEDGRAGMGVRWDLREPNRTSRWRFSAGSSSPAVGFTPLLTCELSITIAPLFSLQQPLNCGRHKGVNRVLRVAGSPRVAGPQRCGAASVRATCRSAAVSHATQSVFLPHNPQPTLSASLWRCSSERN